MKDTKDILIAKAKNQFKEIFPLISRTDFEDAFTIEGNTLIFWFLTGDKSSHVLTADINCLKSTDMSACAAVDVS